MLKPALLIPLIIGFILLFAALELFDAQPGWAFAFIAVGIWMIWTAGKSARRR